MPLVRIDVLEGRSEEQLAAIGAATQRATVECLDVPERDQSSAGLRREDVTIALHENTRVDWSFGNGIASYLTLPKAQWK
jgi:phenylpyruvate tautomerase PptA (4-oxalocrotonate tautomerase family)